MRRYADLIHAAFEQHADLEVTRCCVAEDVSKYPRKIQTVFHHQFAARNGRRLARDSSIDLFHVVDGSHGYLALSFRNRPVVVTVHDIIPKLLCLGKFGIKRPGFLARRIIDKALLGLENATHLIFDSQSTRSDVDKLAIRSGKNDSVIFPPLEKQFLERNPEEATSSPETPFVFHIGNNAFYKNRIGVVEIYSRIAKRVPHRLVLAGPPPDPSLELLAKKLGVAGRIEFAVNPSDQDVRSYYAHASAFVFPSIYEGFGWPPIEAMAMGCPVVCSDGGSLKEVVQDAALVSPHEEIETMAEHLMRLLSDEEQHRDMKARGQQHAAQFTLERFAKEIQAAYRVAIGSSF